MDAATSLSIAAVFISAISAGITLFGYIRDKSKIIAWSEVVYDKSKSLDNPPPCFYLKIVNIGRRPIVLTDIEKIGKNGRWRNPLAEPELDKPIDTVLKEKKIKDIFSTKNTSKVLQEAEFFEASYDLEDFRFEVFSFDDDKLVEATNFFIMDILGKKYPVRNAKKNISVMLAHNANEQ
ncbi:hypothetical protein [Stutzerimonas nitrititolerans]|uniref:hypothetical protein n=1 Tax=Stutzerimonas nitrititolerans TaxID=2482751 RepID=UPI0028AC42C2|nr:hypothetical protein [Stutzerimonas nitrititolerans]